MSNTENPIYRDSPDTPQGPHTPMKPEPGHYCAWDHKEWKEQGLRDYADFSDCVEYKNQEDFGDYTEGDWFYEDRDTLTIYYGSFGNYNAPGASSYTYADVYETLEEFEKELAEYESTPEYIDTEDIEEIDEQDTDDEGIPF